MTNKVFSRMKKPGERLKYVREKLLRLTRKELHIKYDLSQDTLAAWETGRIKLSEKSVDRCIKIFSSENLIVSREWILDGSGLDPKFSFDINRYFNTHEDQSPNETIGDDKLLIKEIEFFRSLTPHSIICMVSYDDMLPNYSRNDYVGGRLRYGDDIEKCVGKDCIIKTNNDGLYVRRLSKNIISDGYNLSCLNMHWDGNPEPIIYNADIKAVAPIIWHRRLDIDH